MLRYQVLVIHECMDAWMQMHPWPGNGAEQSSCAGSKIGPSTGAPECPLWLHFIDFVVKVRQWNTLSVAGGAAYRVDLGMEGRPRLRRRIARGVQEREGAVCSSAAAGADHRGAAHLVVAAGRRAASLALQGLRTRAWRGEAGWAAVRRAPTARLCKPVRMCCWTIRFHRS